LIGATVDGGAKGFGVLYKLSNASTTPTMQTLYTFCIQPDCADGANPAGPLTLFPGFKDGGQIQWSTIYGTTANGGGKGNGGTVFSFPR
jgi:uncharacterized repeat protein (TIGR03803 family)